MSSPDNHIESRKRRPSVKDRIEGRPTRSKPKRKEDKMALYAALDLHSNNSMLAILDQKDRVVFRKRLANNLPLVLRALKPYAREIKGVVVESTYNWYWLVDGLKDNGYEVHLANPTAIEQYDGIKYGDDTTDAVFLARLFRMGILPEGHIYPKGDRPVRDLLRRRMMLVRQRTRIILSLQSMVARELGRRISANEIHAMKVEDASKLFEEIHLRLAAKTNIEIIRFLTGKIRLFEAAVEEQATLRPEYQCLLTVPGIGRILALTISMETGEISRFAQVGNYSSYCRLVKSVRLSNRKKKGEGNQKSGNPYLSWAYIEAANIMKRYHEPAQKFFQRKAAKTNRILATKALANKISKACYFMMRDQVPFDSKRMFG
jgi:transposase